MSYTQDFRQYCFSDASMYAGTGFIDGNVLQIAQYMFSVQ